MVKNEYKKKKQSAFYLAFSLIVSDLSCDHLFSVTTTFQSDPKLGLKANLTVKCKSHCTEKQCDSFSEHNYTVYKQFLDTSVCPVLMYKNTREQMSNRVWNCKHWPPDD